MSRGIGVLPAVQDALPDWAALLVALLTQLGDVWFLVLLVGLVYWFRPDDREEAAVLVGLMLAGFSLVTALKYAFALPRPGRPLAELEALGPLARSLYEATGTADGYGFPSGHAVLTTVVYGGLAWRLSIGTARQRAAAAATVVSLVCASRVALGVHYFVDVVAGVAIGLAFLVVVNRLTARYPTDQQTVAFAIAVAVGVVALVTSGAAVDAVLVFVATLAVFGGLQFARDARDRSSA
ncbi:phosphoesterase PA-phosphatase related protein [Haloterrigena turkmenica DSM 5511]|uniref:Phosphoesterase PA-phosphatase related protein n=1 Tax=Haloterrigena turkmenica (strain ATCC 51198 / DSM 5511 / JCM 9101 / NCIMB 13204 / VKM B-1734 / 4k) TaxID=543526 RepID=D2RU75_HALTV|nr:phosphatase PAP2 family protein [Haloterrigena turkmenica]ADB59144.1 phosphoesterase PA-phosphatase related protein [Haloterrigena turkmenica DSM 5511]